MLSLEVAGSAKGPLLSIILHAIDETTPHNHVRLEIRGQFVIEQIRIAEDLHTLLHT